MNAGLFTNNPKHLDWSFPVRCACRPPVCDVVLYEDAVGCRHGSRCTDISRNKTVVGAVIMRLNESDAGGPSNSALVWCMVTGGTFQYQITYLIVSSRKISMVRDWHLEFYNRCEIWQAFRRLPRRPPNFKAIWPFNKQYRGFENLWFAWSSDKTSPG